MSTCKMLYLLNNGKFSIMKKFGLVIKKFVFGSIDK